MKKGDLVHVRPAKEILATLDDRGELDGLPFMPEMVDQCGRTFRVLARADRVCDTISGQARSMRIADAVFLDDLRCDGSGHQTCQAACRIYWKEAWLRPATAGPPRVQGDDPDRDALVALVAANVRELGAEGEDAYRCQNTRLLEAAQPDSAKDPRTYLRVLAYGDVKPLHFVRVMGRAARIELRWKAGTHPVPPLRGTSSKSPVTAPLNLQPGELVRVRSAEEIEATLNDRGGNRGLWFDNEMLALSGQIFRVRARIDHFIDEQTRKMVRLGTDCVTLEGGICSGEQSIGRWFCRRGTHPYWRECWLERVKEVPAACDAVADHHEPATAVAAGRG